MTSESIKSLFIVLVATSSLISGCTEKTQDTFIDKRDGKEYSIIKIGNYWWMAENLAYIPFVVPPKNDSGIYVYGYQGFDVKKAILTENYQSFGCLYNWATTMNIDPKYNKVKWSEVDSIHQGICPEGWHIPSDAEAKVLDRLFDTSPTFTKSDIRQFTGNAGLKLKSIEGWKEQGNGDNSSGLNFKPGGMRYKNGFFDKINRYGYFWTSTQSEKFPAKTAYYRYFTYSSKGSFRSTPSKMNGFPVRCVKDKI